MGKENKLLGDFDGNGASLEGSESDCEYLYWTRCTNMENEATR